MENIQVRNEDEFRTVVNGTALTPIQRASLQLFFGLPHDTTLTGFYTTVELEKHRVAAYRLVATAKHS